MTLIIFKIELSTGTKSLGQMNLLTRARSVGFDSFF